MECFHIDIAIKGTRSRTEFMYYELRLSTQYFLIIPLFLLPYKVLLSKSLLEFIAFALKEGITLKRLIEILLWL